MILFCKNSPTVTKESEKDKNFFYWLLLALVIVAISVIPLVSFDNSDAADSLSIEYNSVSKPKYNDTSGQLGDNLNWRYDTSTKELSINGSGSTYNGGFFDTWLDYNKVSTMTVKGSDITITDRFFEGIDADTIILKNVSSIGVDAFRNCEAVNLIIENTSPVTCGSGMFSGSNSLVNITINANLERDGYQDPFGYCNKVKSIVYGANATKIYCSGIVPSSVTSVTFNSNAEVLSWRGNSNIIFIDLTIFNSLKKLTLINMDMPIIDVPASVTSLCLENTNTSSLSFKSSIIESIQLENLPLKTLDFGNITSITTLTLNKLQKLDLINFGMLGIDAIKNMNNIVSQNIAVSPDNPELTAKNNILYSKDMKKLLYYSNSLNEKYFTIPEEVEECEDINNDSLITVILHNNLKKCGKITGSSIRYLNIPENLESGVYSYGYSYASLSVVVMPTTFHYTQVNNHCTILKYYSKYIESVKAGINADDKIEITVQNKDSADYPFRIGIKYNEDNILQSSKGTVLLPSESRDYPAVYLSIISGEEEDSHEYTEGSNDENIFFKIGIGMIIIGFLLLVVPAALGIPVPAKFGIILIFAGIIVWVVSSLINGAIGHLFGYI